MIRVEMKRSFLNKDVTKQLEIIMISRVGRYSCHEAPCELNT